MTIKESLQWAKDELRYACERPLYEAEILLAHHLNQERIYLKLHDGIAVDNLDAFKALVTRRAKHEPMEYITGRVSFYDIELSAAPGALIPRPETEILIDRVSAIIEEQGMGHIAEIGVGSGALSIVLARKFPTLTIVATDISEAALAVAKKNIEAFGLQNRITLWHTSLLDGINEPIAMIVSNPPYIAKHTPLAPNVAEYEPHQALYSEERGDELLKLIIMLAQKRGVKYLACEMGFDQKEAIQEFTSRYRIEDIEFYQDLARLDRGFTIRFH